MQFLPLRAGDAPFLDRVVQRRVVVRSSRLSLLVVFGNVLLRVPPFLDALILRSSRPWRPSKLESRDAPPSEINFAKVIGWSGSPRPKSNRCIVTYA